MKDLIVSLAVDGRDRYSEVVKGLEKSIIDANWRGEVRIYKEWPEWVTPHARMPYAFKYDLINRAKEDGYENIIWLDSVMRLIPNKNILELLNDNVYGIAAFDNVGHALINYINDTAIKNLGINYDDLAGVKQTWGGALLFNFKKATANIFFNAMRYHAGTGSFLDDNTVRDGFKGHRHDQAVASNVLHCLEVPLLPYGVIAAAKDVTDQTYIQYGD